MEQIQISNGYLQAVKAIKQAILESRYRAARMVNKEMLALYYWVGNYVSVHSRVDAWNTNAIAAISKMLQQELPGLTGFSETNIKNMRTFYETWCPVLNRQLTSADLNKQLDMNDLVNRQITSADLSEEDYDCFLRVGFSIHREIIRKTSTLEERLYYIRRSAKEFWTFEQAKYHLSEGLYAKQGAIQQTNFESTISEPDFKKRALQSFKDEYMLDFINIEDSEQIDEREIEQSIVLNVKNFIMAFGQDFSFIGNQYRLEVAGKEFAVDLLFFSRRLRSLVAFELKRGEFKPEYTGKMNFYLAALDRYVRLPDENPSIGIILCKSKNEEIVELSFSDTSKPMGVATYRTTKDLPENLRNALPDIEQLKKLMVDGNERIYQTHQISTKKIDKQ
jgi:predicted nuclease of restriction endonuclease-like (RecB) superfamily